MVDEEPDGGEPDFDALLDGLRRSDPITLAKFFHAYAPAIERLAANRLSPGLKRRVAPESIAQSVCRTFLRRAADGQYEIDSLDNLWSLLCVISLNKVRERARFNNRKRRAQHREVGIDHAAPVASPVAAPDEQALFEEAFSALMNDLRPEERQIVEMRLAGQTQVAIAEALSRSERTIRRIMSGLEARLLRQLSDSPHE